ncbi:MAG: hypothetical protein ACKVVP_14470 [Chloroflexota bacterium]
MSDSTSIVVKLCLNLSRPFANGQLEAPLQRVSTPPTVIQEILFTISADDCVRVMPDGPQLTDENRYRRGSYKLIVRLGMPRVLRRGGTMGRNATSDNEASSES